MFRCASDKYIGRPLCCIMWGRWVTGPGKPTAILLVPKSEKVENQMQEQKYLKSNRIQAKMKG
jgi:hypothetical protein